MRDTELNAGDKAEAGRSPCFSVLQFILRGWFSLPRPIPAGCCSKDANQLGKQDTESQGPRATVLRAREEKVSRALRRDRIGRDPSGQLLKKAGPQACGVLPCLSPAIFPRNQALHGLVVKGGLGGRR